MAIYEFRCTQCHAEFEVMRPISEAEAPARCPHCGAQGQRLVSVFASGESYKLRVPERGPFRGQQGSGG